MQDWDKVKKDIQKLNSEHDGILKCRGDKRRDIISTDDQGIRIKTGVKSKTTKLIPYDMIKYGFDRLKAGCIFDSPCFHEEYPGNDCRYSIVGGILVELGLADRIPCYYVKGTGQY